MIKAATPHTFRLYHLVHIHWPDAATRLPVPDANCLIVGAGENPRVFLHNTNKEHQCKNANVHKLCEINSIFCTTHMQNIKKTTTTKNWHGWYNTIKQNKKYAKQMVVISGCRTCESGPTSSNSTRCYLQTDINNSITIASAAGML